MIRKIGQLRDATFTVLCPECEVRHLWGDDQMDKPQQCDDCKVEYIPVTPLTTKEEQLVGALKTVADVFDGIPVYPDYINNKYDTLEMLRGILKEADNG